MSAANFAELKAMIGRLNPYERLLYAAKLMEQLPDIDASKKTGVCAAVCYIMQRTMYETAEAGRLYGEMAQIDAQAKQDALAGRRS